MRGFLLVILLVALFFWGGPMVGVAFLSLPILFVLAVLILAGWKVAESFRAKAS
jgi:hypothetical protein